MDVTNARSKRRLFLALYPDQTQRQCLRYVIDQQHAGLLSPDSRPVPIANLHMTLVFIGSVDAKTQVDIEFLVDDVSIVPFSLTLDRFGYWPKKKMLWVMPDPAVIPEQLTELVAVLRRRLGVYGLTVDQRAYRPHVTMARKMSHSPGVSRIQPVNWSFEYFSLLESVSTSGGVQYPLIRQWPLQDY